MKNFHIEILGNPIAKARARHRRIGNKIITYDIQQQQKETVRTILAQKMIKENTYFDADELLHVDMSFVLSYPKSLSKRKIKAYNDGSYKHASKPDIDNLAKFYLDCCNKIVYPDDCKVVSLNLTKLYSDDAKTIIDIRAEE